MSGPTVDYGPRQVFHKERKLVSIWLKGRLGVERAYCDDTDDTQREIWRNVLHFTSIDC